MSRESETIQKVQTRWAAAAAKLGLLALMVFGVVAVAPVSNARVSPYYIVRNAGASADVRPRILFVLDTSGSMAWRAQQTNVVCRWQECEVPAYHGTSYESRISSARRAIQNVVTATADDATYALMTFDQNTAWDPWVLPNRCAGARRFEWITGSDNNNIWRYATVGAWRLCQGDTIRPYPYLRWDQLGQGSTVNANNQAGVGPSPLLNTNNVPDWQNAYRGVQWFDRFVGVHFQPNNTTDPFSEITNATTGDYGTTDGQKALNVRGHDWYYWPYVDGFPGYGNQRTTPQWDGRDQGGIMDRTGAVVAKLYAPFYLDELSGSGVPAALWGPADADTASTSVLQKTSPMHAGGVDATGGTPWATVVGVTSGNPAQTNDYNSHSSVASYLEFVTTLTDESVCVPTAAVLISDGVPSSGFGGSLLYERLAALRRELGVETYVVGFFLGGGEINNMACAAAGACTGGTGCSSPCDDTPTNDWDTCSDPDNPSGECAWEAQSSAQLQTVLTDIVNVAVDLDVPSGPGATVNNFLGTPGSSDILQTSITSRTSYPSWQGHLAREACDTEESPGVLQPYCEVEPLPAADVEEAFGSCPQQLVWDAGQCLQAKTWTERRLYSHDSDNNVFPIADGAGLASPQFQQLLDDMGLLEAADPNGHANDIAAYLLGRDAPNDWKLAGFANSSAVIVKRMPQYRPEFAPPVAINDPHCGGRLVGSATTLPPSLTSYAQDVNDPAGRLNSPSTHFEQQEAVVIADDMGIIHAFQFNSGNELFGFIPRFALESVVEQTAIGALSYGQVGEVEDHHYGVASTLNQGWVYDDTSADSTDHTWRHLGIIGMGAGGTEWIALDLSHMSPSSPSGPIEVLWTSEDQGLKAQYDAYNGETWARPAIAYHVPSDEASSEPDAFIVMGSGYPESGGAASQGRVLMRADALTGTIIETATLPDITNAVYEQEFAALVDAAVGTHCLSRFWAEAQETYVADPSGRLFRWDLGRTAAHESDSGALWGGSAQLVANTPFAACTGATNCTVNANNPGDPFLFPPAISSNDRIDDFLSGTVGALTETDQFLVAMASGSASDDSLTEDTNYHSSLYVLVDDHSTVPTDGFSIPAGGPISLPGANANYMRVPLSQIERERVFRPFPTSGVLTRTRNFSANTRPIRPPRIFVTGAVDDSIAPGLPPVIVEGVEVYYIEFMVYEPPSSECDPDWHDSATSQWYSDPGQTYRLRFRLTNTTATPFDLQAGADDNANVDFGGGFGSSGLELQSVEQLGGTDCQDGDCGANPTPPGPTPCDNNTDTPASTTTPFSLTTQQSELSGFTPIE